MIGHIAALALVATAAPIDRSPEAAYEAFTEALGQPEAAELFAGGWSTSLGLGGCVPAFGLDYMCVADASPSEPGADGSRMFMAIVQPSDDGWRLGQVWVYDRVEGLSVEPGLTVEGASESSRPPLPECEDVGDYVSPLDGSLEEIVERAQDMPRADGGVMDDDGVCAFVTLCTMDPTSPLTEPLFSSMIREQPTMYLLFASVCPGLLDDLGVGPLG